MRLRFLFCLMASYTCVSSANETIYYRGIFGPEFTFNLKNPVTGEDSNTSFAHLLESHLVYNQPLGEKFSRITIDHRSGFESPHGWWFTFANDGGVIEVQMKPMPISDYEKFADDIQDAIFVSAANTDHFPQLFMGGGHLNISINTFNGNNLLLRNFIVDYFNHNELALGALSYDAHNAGSLSLSPSAVKDVLHLLALHDSGVFRSGESISWAFIHALNKIRQAQADIFHTIWGAGTTRSKRTDITFFQATEGERRLEIRAVRPQQSIYRWIHQIKLFEARINYLAQFKDPIPLKFKVPVRFPKPGAKVEDILEPPVHPVAALKEYYRYITESGLEWKNYREDLWPTWLDNGTVDRFEKSGWFLYNEQKRARKCQDFLDKKTPA